MALPCTFPPPYTHQQDPPQQPDSRAAGAPGTQEPRLKPKQAAQSLTCLKHLPQGMWSPQSGTGHPTAPSGVSALLISISF